MLTSRPVSTGTPATGSAASRKWWTLAAVTIPMFMIMLDNTIVTVALPAIQRGIGATLSELEWVVSAYSLTFAVLLLTGGKLADFAGRRRIFVAGLGIFTLASLWCGLATNGGELIAARAVQGSGGALMLPATIAIISQTFAPEERGMAYGIWSGVSAAALAIGPLVGGILVDVAHWSWIFYINVPIGVAGIVGAFLVIAESRDTTADQRLDLGGLVTSAGAMFLLVFALIEANRRGWSSTLIVSCFVGAALLLVGFVAVEMRSRAPMLDLSLFADRAFDAANSVGLLVMCALFGFIFFISIYLQEIRGYSPIKTGSIFLVSTVGIMFGAPFGGKLADRIGGRVPIAVGMLAFGGTLAIISRLLTTDVAIWKLFPLMFVGGMGFGLVMAPVTTTVVGAVPPDKSGVASGLMQSMRQLGGALGVAISGAIIAGYTSGVAPRTHEYALAYVSGLREVVLLSGILAIAGALIGASLIRRRSGAELVAVPNVH
jgi:EmrB/QacA subfamily drug resistance transporter